MMVELPPEFVRTVENSFGGNGRFWLETFPALLDEAAQRWNLTDIQPVPNLSYNFVAFARNLPLTPDPSPRRGEGNLIVKLGVPQRELRSEIAALRFYKGRGVCRLLDADAEKGMLLLERLEPGHMLATVMDDDLATEIGAGVMKKLWESSNETPALGGVPAADFDLSIYSQAVTTSFIQLKDWFEGFQRLRKRFKGGTGPLPEGLVETAESLSKNLLSENNDETLLHGDFHHYNVLKSARGWLAIDPKGVIGPRGYDTGPFLINPVKRFLNEGNPKVRTERRVSILSEVLGLERERILAWGICHAVLSAWWSIEDNDPGWGEYSLRCAEIFKQLSV